MATETPSIPAIALEYTIPLQLVVILLLHGLLPTVLYMLTHPLSIPFPSAWRNTILKYGQPALLAQADKMYKDQKTKIISQAKGRILEIGAGTGETVKYYDKSKVDFIYGVEPNLDSLQQLRETVVKAGLEDKYEILSFGVEEEKKMIEAGITKNSMDTILCILCLCSIPTPEKMIGVLYEYLKPGGTILIFEHVASDHPLPYSLQTAYTQGGWRYITNGCELNRPTGRYLLESGKGEGRIGWKEVELMNAPGEGWWSLVPHLVGKLVKADSPN